MTETSVLDTITTLTKEATPEAAARLQELADNAPNKEILKAAKKGLYLLSQKGIAVVSVPKAAPSPAKQIATQATRAWGSNIDGAGNRMVWFELPDSDGGKPTLCSVLFNDEVGVKDVFAGKMSRREIEAQVQGTRSPSDAPTFIDLDLDYARWIVAQAREINRRLVVPTPHGFLEIMPRIGEPTGTYETSPAYTLLTPEAVLADTSYSRDPVDFFALADFSTWFLDVEQTIPWLNPWTKIKMEPEESADEATDTERTNLLQEVTNALMPPDVTKRYVGRLEASAEIFLKQGSEQEAKEVLYHALTLREEGATAPFALALVERTMEAAFSMYQAALAKQARERQASVAP